MFDLFKLYNDVRDLMMLKPYTKRFDDKVDDLLKELAKYKSQRGKNGHSKKA